MFLPAKSKNRYEQVYDNFQEWKILKQATSNSEIVLMAYFTELGNNNVSSTLWAKFSMMKATLKLKNKIDISSYALLGAMLKQSSKGQRKTSLSN